jgi:hypothetical protein
MIWTIFLIDNWSNWCRYFFPLFLFIVLSLLWMLLVFFCCLFVTIYGNFVKFWVFFFYFVLASTSTHSKCGTLLFDRLCGLVVRVPGYRTEMYCVSCEVRTEFVYIMYKKVDRLCSLVVIVLGYRSGGLGSIPGTTRKIKM